MKHGSRILQVESGVTNTAVLERLNQATSAALRAHMLPRYVCVIVQTQLQSSAGSEDRCMELCLPWASLRWTDNDSHPSIPYNIAGMQTEYVNYRKT